MNTKLVSLVLLFLLVISCSPHSTQEEEVNYQQLDNAFSDARSIGNLKSLVVSFRGTIIKEAFFGTGGTDIRHDVRSVTKSVMALLIGIALDKGFLSSVDQTLGEFIDPLVYTITPEKAAIKIRHLLTMTSGFEWEEQIAVSGYNDWITAQNQVQYLLNKPLANVPGEYFTYNSAALHLLSVILTKVTGMPTKDFAMLYLFEPLGILEIEWQVDKQGFNNGGAGLKITPHDMVKIGSLILNNGVYNGNTIVSPDYITQMIQPKITTNDSMSFGPDYGYCWWLGQNTQGNYAFANGYGGQFIVVVPNLDLIVVASNLWSGVGAIVASDQWYRTLNLIMTQILPAFN